MIKGATKLRYFPDLAKGVAVGVILVGLSGLDALQRQLVSPPANDNLPSPPPAAPAASLPPVNDNEPIFGGPLGSTVARGEGSYSSYNRGTAGDAHDHKIDFAQMSIGEIMRRQALPSSDPHRLFAVGKYQVTPATMRAAVRSLCLSANTKFDAVTQERIFRDYLVAAKRPEVKAYITGPSENRLKAQEAVAAEFASVANPLTGRSDYSGLSGNAASVSAAAVAIALDKERKSYRLAVATGKSPKEAWDALSGIAVGHATGGVDTKAHRHFESVFGDSIADGVKRLSGARCLVGDAVVGRRPVDVLAAVRRAPDDEIKGRDVFVSTGLSNDPKDRASAEATIAFLKERGARSITVSGLGTGNRKTGDLRPDNAWLAEVAKKYEVLFGGPIPADQLADGVHPEYYRVFRTQLEASLNRDAQPTNG